MEQIDIQDSYIETKNGRLFHIVYQDMDGIESILIEEHLTSDHFSIIVEKVITNED